MEGDENPFGILRLLESSHGFESRIEVTDVGFQPIGAAWNKGIDEMHEGMPTGFLKPQEDIVMNRTEAEDIGPDDSL